MYPQDFREGFLIDAFEDVDVCMQSVNRDCTQFRNISRQKMRLFHQIRGVKLFISEPTRNGVDHPVVVFEK